MAPIVIVLSSHEVPYDPPAGVIAAICEAARGVNGTLIWAPAR
jgi:hypothetical protein